MTIRRVGDQGSLTYYEAVEEILTSGTSWTVPSGVTHIDLVVCIGGGQGGNGGESAGSSNTGTRSGGLGGQGGAVATFFRLPVSGTVTYQIGAGGSGGAGGAATTGTSANSASNGSAGGNTWFGNANYVALGGSTNHSTPLAQQASGGARWFSSIGTYNVPVGHGGRGGNRSQASAVDSSHNGQLFFLDSAGNSDRAVLTFMETGGGAGGSGTSSTVSVQYGRPGGGGSNTAGGTAAQGGQATNTGLNGGNGTGYGSGGGGGAGVKANSVAGGNGGSGANGAIILRYMKPVTVSLRGRAVA